MGKRFVFIGFFENMVLELSFCEQLPVFGRLISPVCFQGTILWQVCSIKNLFQIDYFMSACSGRQYPQNKTFIVCDVLLFVTKAVLTALLNQEPSLSMLFAYSFLTVTFSRSSLSRVSLWVVFPLGFKGVSITLASTMAAVFTIME